MTNERRWSEVNSYFAKTLIGSDPALEATLAANAAAGLPSIDVSAPQGKLIHLLARMSGARKALEIGTLGGYSTIWLARALPDDGRLDHARNERQDMPMSRVETSPTLASATKSRSEPAQRSRRCPRSKPRGSGRSISSSSTRTRPTTRPISNGPYVFRGQERRSWSTMWCGRARWSTRRATATDVVGVRRMFDLMAREPRLSATAIQTVGAKGWDGFALAVVS